MQYPVEVLNREADIRARYRWVLSPGPQNLFFPAVAQSPQPRAIRRHALDRIGHRHQHPARTVPMCLRQQMPLAGINPVVDNARSHLRAEIEGSAHSALDAAIPESRFGRPALQITRKRHSSVERPLLFQAFAKCA